MAVEDNAVEAKDIAACERGLQKSKPLRYVAFSVGVCHCKPCRAAPTSRNRVNPVGSSLEFEASQRFFRRAARGRAAVGVEQTAVAGAAELPFFGRTNGAAQVRADFGERDQVNLADADASRGRCS